MGKNIQALVSVAEPSPVPICKIVGRRQRMGI